jgi:hypothetical protein
MNSQILSVMPEGLCLSGLSGLSIYPEKDSSLNTEQLSNREIKQLQQ